MTLEAKLIALAQAIGVDVKSLNDRIGLNANLTTQTKTTLVSAINEIVANVGNVSLLQTYSFSVPNSVTDGGSNTWYQTEGDGSANPSYYGYDGQGVPTNYIVRFDKTTGTLTSYAIPNGDTSSAVWSSKTTFAYGALASNLSTLTTNVSATGYTNLVSAILAALDAGNIAASLIDDTAGDGVTNKTWSANQIHDHVLTQLTNVIGTAPAVLDTLSEIAAALGNDENFATHVAEALSFRVRVDAAQNFPNAQKQQGRDNIGAAAQSDLATTNQNLATLNANLGDVTHNFLTDYTNARDGVV